MNSKCSVEMSNDLAGSIDLIENTYKFFYERKEDFVYFLKSKMTVHKMFLDLTCTSIEIHNGAKGETFLKGSLDSIPSPSVKIQIIGVKIQIIGGKVYLM